MLILRVCIVTSEHEDYLRDVVHDVANRLNQVLLDELDIGVEVQVVWDYRHATPLVVPDGQLAFPSIERIRKAQMVIAILGNRVGSISTEEVREAFRRRQAGDDVQIAVFAATDRIRFEVDGHETTEVDQLVGSIRLDFGEQIIYAQYNDQLEFQALCFSWFIKAVLGELMPRRDEIGVGP